MGQLHGTDVYMQDVDVDKVMELLSAHSERKAVEARLEEIENITKNPGGLFAVDPMYALPDGPSHIMLEPDAAHLWIRDRKSELKSQLQPKGKEHDEHND